MRIWVRIAVIAVLICSSVAAPAFGQPIIDGNESGNGTDTGINDSAVEAGNESNASAGNESASDDGGGGLLGGGGLMPSVPGPGDWLEGALDWLIEDIQSGVEGYVESLNTVFVGIASPGEQTSPGTWVMPQNGMWDVAAAFYVAAASMSSVVWAAGLVYLFDVESRQKQRELLRTLIYSALATVTGMVLLGLYFNGTNVIVRAIAPGATEFVQDGGGLAQLGLGHAIAAVLIVINSGIVVLGGLIMFGIYLLPLILFAFFPFIVASKTVPVKPLQSTANLGLMTLALLPLLRIIQSLLLRLAEMLTWEASGLGEQIATLFGTAIILTIALLVLPYMFYQNIETASGMALSTITVKKANQGASAVNDAATSAGSRATSRAKSAAAPHANRVRSAANQKAANAKLRAGSRIGGAMLTAKFGRSGSSRQTTSSPSSSSSSTSQAQRSTSKMPTDAATTTASGRSSPSNQSAARGRALNRERRNARGRRRLTDKSEAHTWRQ